MNKEELKSIFKEYVETFDMNERAIIRKFYHSYRVMDISTLIAKNNNFSDNEIEVATVIGLLHDYARFPQWTKYKTYSDIKSIDHADLAVELLFDEEIKKYIGNDEYYETIYNAIKYHNKLTISNDLSEYDKLFCKVIRDADKLDIFYLFSINKDLIEEDNEIISKDIEQDFFSEKQIDRRKVNNDSENIILDLSMVFDLNFEYSYKYLRDTKLIDKIYEGIENKEKFKKYFEYINKFIDERIDKYVRYKI